MTILKLSKQEADLIRAGVDRERHLLEINRREYRQRLLALERRHGMTTTRFLRRFRAGECGDRSVWFDWLFAHQAHAECSKRLAILQSIKL